MTRLGWIRGTPHKMNTSRPSVMGSSQRRMMWIWIYIIRFHCMKPVIFWRGEKKCFVLSLSMDLGMFGALFVQIISWDIRYDSWSYDSHTAIFSSEVFVGLGWVRAAWEFRSIFLANFQCWFISLISCIFLPNTQWPTEEWWKKNDLAGTPIFGSIQSQFWGIKSHFCSWTPLFLTSQLQRCHASPQGCRRLIRCKRRRSDFADIADVLWLVGGLEHEFYDFPFSWECHHPKWRSYFSEG